MMIEEILELPYTISLTPDSDDEGRHGWVAEVEELPGCMTQVNDLAELEARIRDAMAGWLSVALEDGRPIPMPRSLAAHSGRFLVRLPKSLHAELAHEAEMEGVSLNQFVATALAGALSWRQTKITA